MRMRTSLDAFRLRIVAACAVGALGCGSKVTVTTSSSGSGALPSFACESPMALTFGGKDSGYVKCKNGSIHRPAARACPEVLASPPACDPKGGMGTCVSDSDCKAQPHGYCRSASGGGVPAGCYCGYGCISDAECSAGQVCLCGDPVGHCAKATCTSDADCGGQYCSSYVENPGCGGTGFACQSASDSCGGDSDCTTNENCALVNGVHACQKKSCAIGRPFLVEGAARVAPAVRRTDWRADLSPSLVGLAAEERARLADEWTLAGQMEHASIAAFARFSLQLLSLGAPPDLVRAAQQAMADETEHTRLCFALASEYLGRDVGPGPLAIDGAMGAIDEAEIVRLCLEEGCIGETVAAIEAAELGEHAVDPVVRAVLATIAEDEARHAELAWRFVTWAISRDPRLADVARDALATVLAAEPEAGDVTAEEQRYVALGVAHGGAKHAIRRRVLESLVAPLVRELCPASRWTPPRAYRMLDA